MKALFLSILALLPAAASAQRDTLGVLERSSVFSAGDERAVAGFHTESPAMMLYRSEQSLSQISLRIDLRREQEALLQPLGDGALDGGFYAESYRRLSERSAAWADARYVRGNRRNVCWNSTADYLLLYPCITADSAGGNLSTEEYAFGGGYVHRVGRFDLAIRGDYRAGQEYRWKRHDSLTVRGNKWYRHSQSKGGGPVDFVMEFFGKSFTEAVELLTGEQGAAAPDRPSPAPLSDFRLPPRSDTADK